MKKNFHWNPGSEKLLILPESSSASNKIWECITPFIWANGECHKRASESIKNGIIIRALYLAFKNDDIESQVHCSIVCGVHIHSRNISLNSSREPPSAHIHKSLLSLPNGSNLIHFNLIKTLQWERSTKELFRNNIENVKFCAVCAENFNGTFSIYYY